jgi:hypothetical protein
VQSESQGPELGGRRQHTRAVAAAGVHHDLAGTDPAGGREPLDQVGKGIVGHGQQQQVGRPGHRDGGPRAEVGKQRLEPHPGGGGRPGRRHHGVAGLAERGGEDGADAAGADDADPVARGAVRGHR